jgi:hypothetical protein
MSRSEEASTILRTIKRLMALSFGMAFPVDAHLEYITRKKTLMVKTMVNDQSGNRSDKSTNNRTAQTEMVMAYHSPSKNSTVPRAHLTRLTCPRPCLFLPWLRLLTGMIIQ